MQIPRRRLVALAATTMSVALALTTAPTSSAATPPSAPRAHAAPAAGGVTQAPWERRLDRALRQVRVAGGLGVTAQVDGPRGTWSGAAGYAQLDPRKPAKEQARFRAASVTKQLTTVLALDLVERDRWTLSTTIGDVLPRLWPRRADVTLEQLLSHRSGMPDMLTPLIAQARTDRAFVKAISKRRTDSELVKVAKTQDWLFEPGTSMAYSNTNFIVVGMMLKKATGRSMAHLVRSRILGPAGMTSSVYATSRGMAAPRLKEYAVLGPRRLDVSTFHPSMFSSAGALVTTARDLNRFQRALSRGRLVARRLVTTMRRVTTPDGGPKTGYGLGSYRLLDPCGTGRVLHGHDGGSWGTVTLSFTTPSGGRRVSVAMTGRELNGDTDGILALLRFVTAAMAAQCGAPGGPSGEPSGGAPDRAPGGTDLQPGDLSDLAIRPRLAG